MKRTFQSFTISLLSFITATSACSQWVKQATSVIVASSAGSGALIYDHGKLWAGSNTLQFSIDLGASWTQITSFGGVSSIQGAVASIRFFDAQFGAFTTSQGAIYLTSDGGMTWGTPQRLFNEESRGVAFGRTRQQIVACGAAQVLEVSTDGGATWTSHTPPGESWAHDVYYDQARDRWVASASADSPPATSHLYISTDVGQTWTRQGGGFDYDSYSLTHDSCSSSTIYVMDEDWASSSDQRSQIYSSTDDGATWKESIGMPVPFFSGCIETGASTIYAPVTGQAIYRSSDGGNSWKSIGGPSVAYDNRLLAVIDDNTLVAIDGSGDVWLTTNSGGDSVHTPKPGMNTPQFTPAALFYNDTVLCGGTLVASVGFQHAGCHVASVMGWRIEGADSLNYRVSGPAGDSIGVVFDPQHEGDSHALLIVSASNGGEDTVILSGAKNSEPFSFTFSPQSEFVGDSLYLCSPSVAGTVALHFAGCLSSLVNVSITGSASGDYSLGHRPSNPLAADDSVVIRFKPTGFGLRDGMCILKFADGSTIRVPLEGVGVAPTQLSLSTADQSTDTLGGRVVVPISINDLPQPEDVELVLEFDPSLHYVGTFAPNGAQLDLPSEQWSGRSRIRIPRATSGAVVANAHFDVFATGRDLVRVLLDSIEIVTATPPCRYAGPVAVMSEVAPPYGCGMRTILQFMLTGTLPSLTLVPNPASAEVTIRSTASLAGALVSVTDVLGHERTADVSGDGRDGRLTMHTETLPDGIYLLRIQMPEGTTLLRLVVSR